MKSKTVHMKDARSPTTPSAHDLLNPDPSSEINTKQQAKGMSTKARLDTTHTRTSPAPPRLLQRTSSGKTWNTQKFSNHFYHLRENSENFILPNISDQIGCALRINK